MYCSLKYLISGKVDEVTTAALHFWIWEQSQQVQSRGYNISFWKLVLNQTLNFQLYSLQCLNSDSATKSWGSGHQLRLSEFMSWAWSPLKPALWAQLFGPGLAWLRLWSWSWHITTSNEPFWMQSIKHQGTGPFNLNPSSYAVFQNVKVSTSFGYQSLLIN